MNKLLALIRSEEKKPLVIAGELLIVLIAIQLFYPMAKLPPFMSIDGLNLSGWSKSDAALALDEHYQKQNVPIFLGESADAYKTVALADTGIVVDNQARLEAVTYPWYLRLVPTSILWSHFFLPTGAPATSVDEAISATFIEKDLNPKSCSVEPKNATIKTEGANLTVQVAVSGGTCTEADIRQALNSFNPHEAEAIRVPVAEKAADVTTDEAQQLADKLNQQLGEGINVVVLGQSVRLPREQLVSWTEFKATGGDLDFSFSADKASAYLNENIGTKVRVEPTTTTVRTTDFVETSRVSGKPGQQLGVAGTLKSVKDYVDGKTAVASAVVAKVSSPVVYKRSYTNTHIGMLALMQNFAASHKGTYGISLVELSGQRRTASYNGGKQFVTASIYKLYVAYSTLLRVDRGSWKWTDTIVDGKNLATCFDDMIVVSDNNCAMALLKKIGYSTITNEAHALGLSSTSFMGENIMTAPQDVASLLTSLARGEILTKASRDRWISAMKRNVYRQGIPSGTSSVVADKVGFLWELLHDAGIVYSSHGTYVLVVLTDKSSWSNIADLTHQLDKLIAS